MLINNFISERFLKTTERIQIEIHESANVDTETTIYIINVVSVKQKGLGHEDLVGCTSGLRFVKDSCIVNDKMKK